MEKRKEIIQEWIDARKERGETTKCMFYITVPKDTDLYKDETVKKIEGILDRNKVSHGHTGMAKEVTVPEGITAIGDSAFSYCDLTSIKLPESVTSIGEAAFNGCRSLTSIELPENVTSIEYATFSGCRSLTSIELPESVTSIGYNAFEGL